MNNKEYFTIIYDGEALIKHEFDVRELAPALLGVADLLEETNRITNSNNAKVQINVNGNFQSGSFPIDLSLTQDVLTQVTNIFNQPTVTAAINLLTILGFAGGSVSGLIQFIKWLKNRKIKQIRKVVDNSKVIIELEDGAKITIPEVTLKLFSNIKIRQSIESIIYKPLSLDGIEVFKIKHKSSEIIINKAEKDYFATPEIVDEIISENFAEKSLQLLTISFVDGNKWRFSDGKSQFYAEIKDDSFVQDVKSGNTNFAIDDIFKVKLHEVQVLTESGMRTDSEVLQVLEHRPAQRGIQLPLIG
jgi:hypothetical protein